MSKIYIWATEIWESGMMGGVAISEDGVQLSAHLSSSEAWFQHDMGITSDWKHDKYKAHYPDGYELIYVSIVELSTDDPKLKNAEFEAWYEETIKKQQRS